MKFSSFKTFFQRLIKKMTKKKLSTTINQEGVSLAFLDFEKYYQDVYCNGDRRAIVPEVIWKELRDIFDSVSESLLEASYNSELFPIPEDEFAFSNYKNRFGQAVLATVYFKDGAFYGDISGVDLPAPDVVFLTPDCWFYENSKGRDLSFADFLANSWRWTIGLV